MEIITIELNMRGSSGVGCSGSGAVQCKKCSNSTNYINNEPPTKCWYCGEKL